MRDTNKSMLIALSSRFFIIAVLVLCAMLFARVNHLTMLNVESIPITSKTDPFSFFTSLFARWDSAWYLTIAQYGYPLGAAKPFGGLLQHYTPSADPQWAFFPLYPAAMRALASLMVGFKNLSLNTQSPVSTQSLIVSGIIISNAAFFVSVYFFYKLTNKLFNSTKIALISVVFYSFWIATVFYSAVYSEALFMALALGSFYYLEEKKFDRAVLLGILATLTRSDGFLIAIPFLVYALQVIIPKLYKHESDTPLESKQSLIKPHLANVKLLLTPAVIALPYLIWNVVGYFLAGGVFPVQQIADHSNWGIYPPLLSQFSYYHLLPSYEAFWIAAMFVIIALPAAYFIVGVKKVFTQESNTLKYWAFYASIGAVIFTQSILVYSVYRYAIPMLPIYWICAKIYIKNHAVGLTLLALIIVLSIIGIYLYETQSSQFL